MLSSHVTNALSTTVVKYYGRNVEISRTDVFYSTTVNQLISTTSTLKAVASKDSSWNSLSTEVSALTNFILDPQNKVKRFQIEILLDGLLPYLNKLNGRLHFDKQRFRQISNIITALSSSDVVHPAMTLQTLDEVVVDLRQNKSYLWKSELLTILENAVEKQWQPIVSDNRNLLLNIGGKFIIVGLIGVVGWPLAFLYPLYRVAQNMARIASEYETQKRVTMESIVEVCKTLVVIFAAMQLLTILSLYASLGYFCMACGGAALFLAANKTLLKQLAPAMAPHVTQIDLLLSVVDGMDHSRLLGLLRGAAKGMSHTADIAAGSSKGHTKSSASSVFSSRVEELPMEQQTVETDLSHDDRSSPLSAPSSKKSDELHSHTPSPSLSPLSAALPHSESFQLVDRGDYCESEGDVDRDGDGLIDAIDRSEGKKEGMNMKMNRENEESVSGDNDEQTRSPDSNVLRRRK